MTTSLIAFELGQPPFCCGAREMGELLIVSPKQQHFRSHAIALDDKCVQVIKSRVNGRPTYVHFVQVYDEDWGEFADEYECQEFLDLLEGHPDVVDLGTWINPGSDNRIHGFMIKGDME